MKRIWTEEQSKEFGNDKSIVQINNKILDHLRQSIDCIITNDYDTAFRLASGSVEAMFKYQDDLRRGSFVRLDVLQDKISQMTAKNKDLDKIIDDLKSKVELLKGRLDHESK